MSEKLKAQAKSTKFQTPSSKEAPSPKLQTPNTKHQTPEKLQAPSSKRGPRFGAWNLGFLWCLELGGWCFDSGTSLELGVSLSGGGSKSEIRTAPVPVIVVSTP